MAKSKVSRMHVNKWLHPKMHLLHINSTWCSFWISVKVWYLANSITPSSFPVFPFLSRFDFLPFWFELKFLSLWKALSHDLKWLQCLCFVDLKCQGWKLRVLCGTLKPHSRLGYGCKKRMQYLNFYLFLLFYTC